MMRNFLFLLAICVLAGCAGAAPAPAPQPKVEQAADTPAPQPLPYENRGPNYKLPELPPAPWMKHPLKLTSDNDGIPHIGRTHGRPVVETSGGGGGVFLYFCVDNDYAFDIDETVLVHVVYDPSVAGKLHLEYDSNFPEPNGGRYYPCKEIIANKDLKWAQHTFTLHRAKFADRLNNGSDIRIMSPGGRVRLADIRIERPYKPDEPAKGTLKLRFVDAKTGATTPVRMGLYRDGKRIVYPGDQAVPVWIFHREARIGPLWRDFSWPVENKSIFYSPGEFQKEIPSGNFTLVARKGIEYRIVKEELKLEPGKTLDRTIKMERWDDLPAKGWWSGDGHVHIGRTRERDVPIHHMIAAEDVHIANIVRMGDIEKFHFPQYGFGPQNAFSKGGYIVFPGHEDPRTPHRGHTLIYNTKKAVRDEETYFLYHRAFEEAHRQGALNCYSHWGMGFHAERGMAVDVPFNLVDLVEILQFNKLQTVIYYEWLNLGYKLVPMAGSDFPYGDVPGGVRVYCRLDGPFDDQAWFKALASGNCFVTNGPILTFTVNGKPMGSEIAVDKGEKVTVEATARMNPDIDKLLVLELIVHGEVVKTVSGDGQDLVLKHELPVEQSTWVAVKARGKEALSHSGSIYLVVDGRRFWNLTQVPDLVNRQRSRLDEMMNTEPKTQHEHWLQALMTKKWKEQKPLLQQRVDEAKKKFDELMKIYEKEK